MKKMVPISDDEARDKHKITCEHTRTEVDGELRFRLIKKSDGTMYIRTEAGKGGWQDSHWHKTVMETYIVQSGWIGYAESRGGEPELYIYRAGESFTTPPGVIHNVYLHVGSVIHTVKHGQAQGEDRFEDDKTKDFTERVRLKFSDIDRLERLALAPARTAIPAAGGRQSEEIYSPAYMHFDNLIWQVPAWATAIFAIVLAGMTQLQPSSPLVGFVNLKIETLLAGSALMFGLMLMVLSYALYRFRWHQIRTKSYIPRSPYWSPQIGLQAIVNVQAVVLLLISLRGFGFSVGVLISGVIVASIAFMIVLEQRLARKGKERTGLPETTAS